MRLACRLANRLAELAPGGARRGVAGPIASLTFDDFPRSAWTCGGPLLQRHGVRASFYPAGGFCGRFAEGNDQFTAADLREVRDAGHEIGCHTFSHRALPSLSPSEFIDDLDRNAAFLADEAGVRPQTFAYPYGFLSPSALPVARRRFRAGRRVKGGVNAGRFDPARLAAFPIEARSWSQGRFTRVLEATVRRRGWLVLFTHDVAETPTPYGCTPQMLSFVVEALARAQVGVLAVEAALELAA